MGSLIYLTLTKPDIAIAVDLLLCNCNKSKSHILRRQRNLEVCEFYTRFGLLYFRGARFELHGFTDTKLGGDLDDHNFRLSYLVAQQVSLGVARSKKRDSVFSNTKVEYKVSTLVAQECVVDVRQKCLFPIH